MDDKNVDSLAQLLRKQRQHFLEEFRRAEEHLGYLAEERESEIEGRAQGERSARLLLSLDDRTLFAVREIDAALRRVLDGTYGHCEACRKKIPIARLRALPAARLCRNCAGQKETSALRSTEDDVARRNLQPLRRPGSFDESEFSEAADEQFTEEPDAEA